MKPFDELVTIGRLVKPQGRRGEVLTESLSDRPDRFPSLRRAFVPAPDGSAREVIITSCWPHKGRFVLKIEGVDSIDDAERFRGLELRIGEESLDPLPEGSFYHHELRGLQVVHEGGEVLGTVADILVTGSAPVLVVRGGRGEILIPLAERFIRRVDVAGRRMIVAYSGLPDAGSSPTPAPPERVRGFSRRRTGRARRSAVPPSETRP